MADQPSFKEVLKNVEHCCRLSHRHRGWNKKLGNFFDRWLNNETGAGLWEKIADDVAPRLDRRACFDLIARSAVSALADGYGAKRLNPVDLRRLSTRLSNLSKCAQSLANYHRQKLEDYEKDRDRTLMELYQEEAKDLHQGSDELLLKSMSHELIRRQKGGKKFTQEHLAFMRSLAKSMQWHFGKPYREAVAEITNRAYSNLNVGAEDISAACKGAKLKNCQITR